MKKLFIKCNSVEEKIAAFALLGMYGYSYRKESATKMALEKHNHITDKAYLGIMADPSDKDLGIYLTSFTGDVVKYTWDSDLTSIVSYLDQKIESMKLTKDYDATVSKDGVQVGCQLITFEKLDELVALTKNFR